MPGYLGKLLHVNLSTGRIDVIEPDPTVYEQFLGGYGLGARLLYSMQHSGAEPLGPENHLMFASSPLVGTPVPMASRYAVMGKSPLTGTWGDANAGGTFGPMLKFAGYDAILLHGIAERPVYLWLHNGRAELRDGQALWGMDTQQTIDRLRQVTHAKAEVACIGPAGEKSSLISCIIGPGGRAAGRSGLGAVMGSKRLKALVVYGNQPIPVAHPQQMCRLRQKYLYHLSGLWADSLREFGTSAITAEAIRYGAAPTKNWQGMPGSDFPGPETLSATALMQREIGKHGCYGCPIQCSGYVQVGTTQTRKPEHQTLSAFGPLCLNTNLEAIIQANNLCDRYGLDTISTGSTIAFAMECYEQGLLDATATDGVELTWGNARAMVTLTEKIALREGFGDVLADGVKVAAQRIGKGSEAFAVHIQGQEPAMHDPKFSPGYATSYKMDATPGRHTQGGAANVEGYPPEGIDLHPIGKHAYNGKGVVHKQMSSLVHVVNAAGLCLFGILCIKVQAIPEFLHAAMGTDYSLDDLYRLGERIANIRHAFNLREGVNSVHCKLPQRLLKGMSHQGTGWSPVNIDLDVQVEDYLHAMDWDRHTGKPSRRKLAELGLHDVVRDLW
jgi:aldehyde:ferredoxin oxidoreductase